MTRLTMQDIRAAKGRRKLIQLNVDSPDQARAAFAAGIDIIVNGEAARWPAIRAAVPDTHLCLSLRYADHASGVEVLRAAFDALAQGADSIYCPLSPALIEPLTREGIPVCAHAGYVPQKSRMTGLRAFGKTDEEARALYRRIKDFEQAGATMVELELVAAPVAALLTPRTTMATVSIGSGGGCDVTYLFGVDILNETPRRPRHARAWDDFGAEARRLHAARVGAFTAFREDVTDGRFPGPTETVAAPPGVADAFTDWLDRQPRD
ncbi:MAG: 3-methyl-2-oxobutanoate hydroxymethyltransferase [Tabrizicola sp.]|jgi:3-methyl-2-oxobutanoate hydroxymethyltransferase|nr:3-methyl-2-oxobutanoate hydroxymethyltransferase [Tabrizicola sp.]